MIAAVARVHGPHIDWAGISPLIVLAGGTLVVLLVGLLRNATVRQRVVPALTLLTLAATVAFEIWRWHHHALLVSGALVNDDLALTLDFIFAAAAAATVLLAWRSIAARETGHGEFCALLLTSILGMAVLVAAQNTITLFLGLELLSIPLYVLCATEARRASSLESGLKYLVVGSVGSATLLYGLALIYGATGTTDFAPIAHALQSGSVVSDPMLLTGIALVIAGLAFKASVAPFHQWTPDVYEGAPTAVTAFMATATKAAALGVFLRFFDSALIGAQGDWGPWLAVLATVTIIVGNVGALGQTSLKRMLAYSSVAQAGYMLSGVVVSTQLGIKATVLYLIVYLLMNMAAFAVVIVRERETDLGDDIAALNGIGSRQPWLAWPMTIAMLSLAGIPATAGFVGKFYLIQALVDGGYTWLAIVLVLGSAVSLGYYLRVIAAIWMGGRTEPKLVGGRPAIAGGSPEADAAVARAGEHPEVAFIAVLCGAATIFFGIVPGPLFRLVAHTGRALSGIF